MLMPLHPAMVNCRGHFRAARLLRTKVAVYEEKRNQAPPKTHSRRAQSVGPGVHQLKVHGIDPVGPA
jgi:hypothetical protein